MSQNVYNSIRLPYFTDLRFFFVLYHCPQLNTGDLEVFAAEHFVSFIVIHLILMCKEKLGDFSTSFVPQTAKEQFMLFTA